MAPLIDRFGNQINPLEPKKWWKKPVDWYEKNPKLFIGGILSLLAFFGIQSFDDIIKLYEKTFPKEIKFTNDPGYKVLLLRFQPYESCPSQDYNIEIAIQDRLMAKSEEENLELQVLLDIGQPYPQTYNDARKIGIEKGADLVIWGDLYERCYNDIEASLSYVVLDSSTLYIEKQGKSDTETITSLVEIKRNGQLQKDIDFVIYWTLGMQAKALNDCERAKHYFENIFQKFHDKASDSYFMLAVCYQNIDNFKLAESNYSLSIQLNPNFTYAYGNRGVLKLFHQYDFKGAIEDFTKAIETKLDYSTGYIHRGIANYFLGKIEDAFKDIAIAIEIDSSDFLPYYNRALIYQYQNKYKLAIIDYTKAIEKNNKYSSAYNNRGFVYYQLGKYDSAIADFNNAIKINQNHQQAYYNRALTNLAKGDVDEAISNFNKLIEINPNHEVAYHNLGVIFFERHDYECAIEYFTKAIQCNHNYVTAYYYRGLAKQSNGDTMGAKEDFNKIKEINERYIKND